jgi:hypothetical protein
MAHGHVTPDLFLEADHQIETELVTPPHAQYRTGMEFAQLWRSIRDLCDDRYGDLALTSSDSA